MDPITHTLTGLYLGRVGLSSKIPRGAVLLMLAANAPDIDVISLAAGPAAALHWHRHFTHSFAFAPVLALALAALFRLFVAGPFPWLRASLACCAAIFSHILLDLTNVYGTHAGLPFRTDWMHWDITYIVDFWIWALLLAALLGPLLGRLVSGEISSGARGQRPFGRGWAIFALTAVLLFEGVRATLHARAVATLDARLYDDAAPLRVAAYPGAFNPLVWNSTAETERSYYFYDLNLAGYFDPSGAKPVPKSGPGAALPALRKDPEFREFLDFNQAPLWQVTPAAAGNEVQLDLIDLRFGSPSQSGFVCSAIADQRGAVRKTECSFGAGPPASQRIIGGGR